MSALEQSTRIQINTLKFDKRALETLRQDITQFAKDNTKTADLCTALRLLKQHDTRFDWVDAEGNTFFHYLADTCEHDWFLLTETLKAIFPKSKGYSSLKSLWTLGCSILPETLAEVETLRSEWFPAPFERKNQHQETPLSRALRAQNLPFAQLAWEYHNTLRTKISLQGIYANLPTWFEAIQSYRNNANSQALLGWVLRTLFIECDKANDDFYALINISRRDAPGVHWIGHLITSNWRMSDSDKVALFAQINKYYQQTKEDRAAYVSYCQRLSEQEQNLDQKALKVLPDIKEVQFEAIDRVGAAGPSSILPQFTQPKAESPPPLDGPWETVEYPVKRLSPKLL